MLCFASSTNNSLHLRLCTVDCLVKTVSHWKTSGRLTGTGSPQTQVGLDTAPPRVTWKMASLTNSSTLPQVPCVTCCGQIHSRRSVPTHPIPPWCVLEKHLVCSWFGPRMNFLSFAPVVQNGRSISKRGVSCQFGPDVTERFLEQNKLDFIVRSHEVKAEGYEVTHSGKCITVFSAPNYWYVLLLDT